jgi:hypothetical protein
VRIVSGNQRRVPCWLAGNSLRAVRVGAFGERGDGGFVAVWCDALLEVVERLGEADGLDAAG